MKKLTLGNSDLEVSVACLGCMLMGERCDEEESFKQMDYFREQGGNFYDTAELYSVPTSDINAGLSEEIMGRWMAARGCRSECIIATKVCGFSSQNRYSANRTVPKNTDAPNARASKADILAAAAGSCRRLQIDTIDLYQLHWPERYAPGFGLHQFDHEKVRESLDFEEVVSAMADLIKAGTVRHWGLSNETAYGVTMMCETAKRLGAPLPVTIQNDYSLTERHFDFDLAEACFIYGVKLIPYGVLAGGYLSGKYLDGKKPEGCRHTAYAQFQPRYATAAMERATIKYKALADKKGISLTTLAIAWVAQRWHIGAIITGQTSVPQLEEYLPACEGGLLDEETLKEVERIHREDRCPGWMD